MSYFKAVNTKKLNKLIEEVQHFSREDAIIVGIDGSTVSGKYSVFSVVVVIHHTLSGGAYVGYEHQIIEEYKSKSRQARLLREIEIAVEHTQYIQERVKNKSIEVHLDINSDPSQYSNCLASTAVGWVYGSTGIKPKLKPHSYAASIISDKRVRKFRRRRSHITSMAEKGL